MKKIINGKVYDTETARQLGEYENDYPRSDFHWYSEQLYQKRTGEFFLFGEGHAASKYAKAYGLNEYGAGEKITPMSYTQAQKWAEEHLDADEYIGIFGEPDEEAEDVQLNLTISAAIAAKFKKIAQERSITQKELFEALVKEA
jgi:hypothetical protein